jgi:hypothetical protein
LALGCLLAGGLAATARASFTETYDDGTDVGHWVAAFSQPRNFEPNGGNPGVYLEQDGFSSHTPTWGTASPDYQPGFNDTYKTHSVFVDDWTDAGVVSLSADMNIFQAGGWGPDRGVTLQLLQMDSTGFNVNFSATYSMDLGEEPPVGWQTYSFPVNADSPTVPAGWVFTDGNGDPGTDAEWSQFLRNVDLTTIGYYKPGFAYVGFGTWTLGIDNIHIETVPEPGAMALLAIGLAGLGGGALAQMRRRKWAAAR